MKTSELLGPTLDWAVAKCKNIGTLIHLGYNYELVVPISTDFSGGEEVYTPSTNWSQGGPIIERENIGIGAERRPETPVWAAQLSYSKEVTYTDGTARRFCTMRGPTPLIAALRCYVASKLGDEVDVPEELLK